MAQQATVTYRSGLMLPIKSIPMEICEQQKKYDNKRVVRVPGEYPFYPKPLPEGAIYTQPIFMEILDPETNETTFTIDYSKKSQ